MIKIICDVPIEADETDAGGLWDLAGELAVTAGLERGLETPVYGEEYGQESIYNRLRELVVERKKTLIVNKEKEIEEMRLIMAKNTPAFLPTTNEMLLETATKLRNAGYGDVKQAVKEFMEKIEEKAIKGGSYEFTPVVLVSTIEETFKELYGND